MVYTATEIIGDGDKLLEPGELFTIQVAAADNTGTIGNLAVNDRWTLHTPEHLSAPCST